MSFCLIVDVSGKGFFCMHHPKAPAVKRMGEHLLCAACCDDAANALRAGNGLPFGESEWVAEREWERD